MTRTKKITTLALLGAGASLAPMLGETRAGAEPVQPPAETSTPAAVAEEEVTATVKVDDIDKQNRKLTVKTPDGDRVTLAVPPDTKNFDKLKKGDQIDLDYHRAAVLSLAPAGAAGGTAQPQGGGMAQQQGSGASKNGSGRMGGSQRSGTAQVVSVNQSNNTLQVKDAKGKQQTLSTQDPSVQNQAQSLHPGDAIELTYTEAVAVGISPHK